MEPERRIMLVTGETGTGKSVLVLRVLEDMHAGPWRIGGVVSAGRFAEGHKVGLDVVNLANGEVRSLASLGGGAGLLQTSRWRFDAAGIAWGGEAIARAVPCDLLVIDELGPLELERAGGWQVSLDVLRHGAYRAALVVVRSSLVARFRQLVPGPAIEVFSVTPASRDPLTAKIIARLRETL